ncbi:molybdenum ABC transporter ATP-binding protein [Pseudohoeflea suaedae]|uniref:Molybdenum ABC transporter ATP-binding protein n=1 Tax=Pseudohoeflea suaedae TaxID=877384 RepID=A0A4R5PKY8_9HYPH|nr:molybdenum ABC transporter ATP-binding protein [Pseudohoeflea suaedae]TDH35978.1 molybdenum ABC transporter ATP-binding protein [Pseudohoeflea suaedae]
MSLAVSLKHRFGTFRLDVDFEAPAGVTALYGRSGSGKTTMVNAVAGLLKPDAGIVSVDGVTLTDINAGLFVPPHKRRIGYVFQEPRLFPHLSVRSNLIYGARFAGLQDEREFDRIVGLLGIGTLLDRRPSKLSGGEKSRVALGRAILSKPRLLLMDEPLAALDEARKAEILPYFERLRDETGLPILYVSHSPAEVARLATTVVLVEDGRVAAIGAAAEVFSDPGAAHALGLREAGAVLTARIEAQEADGLTRLSTSAGPLLLPAVNGPPGTMVRVRLLAQDVMLATDKPSGISALNVLPARVRDIREGEGPGALVRLEAGDEIILARITRRSASALDLAPGRSVHAILKAVSIARESVGEI